ncbi:MAG: DUF1292 domain-containing protein [Bacilli bacterium]|nr:DUF1292 domain-containing protein [Bacilli bacterium]
MKEEKITFKLTDENGVDTEYEVLLTFESNETNKNYMLYTDNTVDEEGNVKVYASIYEPNADGSIDSNTTLKPVESDSEWKIIETILDELQKDATDVDSE